MKSLIRPVLLVSFLLSLAAAALYPGLTGGFIFDDFHSFKKLAIFNDGVSLDSMLRYLGASDTGPLKRPISIFSFLFDANNWPADPYPFKRTNLLIHLFNGFLLFWLIRLIFLNHKEWRNHADLVAFFAAGFWVLHPFFVSTTFYLIQRMAMLPLTFALLGFIGFAKGRMAFRDSQGRRKMLLFASTYLVVTLAVLSKENGILYVFFIALFDAFVVRGFLGEPKLPAKLHLWLLKLPVICLVALLLFKLPSFLERYDVRSFSLYERVLTESRVLVDYLYHLFVPKYFTAGVFNDGFVVSKGLFEPLSTFFSMIFIGLLLGVAFWFGNRYIWSSFAVFFFFTAHVLESTVLPLELYYEHRNYVAAVFFGVPLAMLMVHLINNKSKVFYLVAAAFFAFLAFTSYLRATVWSDNFKLHDMTMNKFPNSIRAATLTASFYLENGYTNQALDILSRYSILHDHLQLKLNKALLQCGIGQVDPLDMDYLFDAFKETEFADQDIAPFKLLYQKLMTNQCSTEQGLEYAQKLLQALEGNSFRSRKYAQKIISSFRGFYELEHCNFAKATELFIKVLQIEGDFRAATDGLIVLLEKDSSGYWANQFMQQLQAEYQRQFKYKPDLSDIAEQLEEIDLEIKQRLKNNEDKTVDSDSCQK